jgi:hypothetical protein
MANIEDRSQNEGEEDFINEAEAEADGDGDGDVEEFEDEEEKEGEKESRHEKQVRRYEQEA